MLLEILFPSHCTVTNVRKARITSHGSGENTEWQHGQKERERERERNKVCQSNGKPTARITFVGAQSDAEHPLVSPPTTFHLQYFHIGRKLPTEM